MNLESASRKNVDQIAQLITTIQSRGSMMRIYKSKGMYKRIILGILS